MFALSSSADIVEILSTDFFSQNFQLAEARKHNPKHREVLTFEIPAGLVGLSVRQDSFVLLISPFLFLRTIFLLTFQAARQKGRSYSGTSTKQWHLFDSSR